MTVWQNSIPTGSEKQRWCQIRMKCMLNAASGLAEEAIRALKQIDCVGSL